MIGIKTTSVERGGSAACSVYSLFFAGFGYVHGHAATIESALMRVIERNRWTVYVKTTPDGNGGWFLRIEDGRGNMTGWVESFQTEQAAIDAAIEAIDHEGIETFIGQKSDMPIFFDA